MDASGNVYELDEVDSEELLAQQREDVARLDGFLRGRAEGDRVDHAEHLARVREERLRFERRLGRV
jgi:hypothetical protein